MHCAQKLLHTTTSLHIRSAVKHRCKHTDGTYSYRVDKQNTTADKCTEAATGL